jgi:response regulator RpfG family c-di-GMP phosphodiesterase
MRMPGLNGLEVLKKLRKLAPDTQRIMLTGNVDQEAAVNAVNEGSIFRFYTKPCPAEALSEGIDAAIKQYQIITIERDLLEKTLAGSVKVLTDVLALAAPKTFRHSARFRDWARIVSPELEIALPWELEIAAMLSPIGLVTLPSALAAKWESGKLLSADEQKIVDQLPAAGKRLVGNIPRMQGIAEIIYYQDKNYDGSGFPEDGVKGSEIPLGGRILKIFKALNDVCQAAAPNDAAFEKLAQQRGKFDPHLLHNIANCLMEFEAEETQETGFMSIPVGRLREGDILKTDVIDIHGALLLSQGTRLSATTIERLRNLHQMGQLKEHASDIAIDRPASAA